MESKRAEHEDDCVDEVRDIIRDNRAELTDIEQSVIEHRFALKPQLRKKTSKGGAGRPLTLEQVGQLIGVRALAYKIRQRRCREWQSQRRVAT